MQDSLSGAILGLNGFSKTLVGFLAASAGSRFDVDQPIARALALVLFTFADGILRILLGALVHPGAERFVPGLGAWVLSAAFNTLFGMILFGYRSRFADATT
jgi:rod shape-determining protein MreD